MEKIGINTNEKLEDLVTVSKTTETKEKGPKPIRACIVDMKEIDMNTKKIVNYMIENGVNVSYFGTNKYYKENGMKSGGFKTYAISECNNKDKFSDSYLDCTGVIVAGKNEKGEEVSFMTHQDPESIFTKKHQLNFIKDLATTLDEMKNICIPGSIDVVMFGGNPRKNMTNYEKSIKYIGLMLEGKLGIDPTVLTGPNIDVGSMGTDAFYNTKDRLLYIVRMNQGTTRLNESYLASEFNEQSKKW
jgi:hypothetical protein